MRRRSRVGMLAGVLVLLGLFAAIPAERAGAVCFGDGCRGLDPSYQGCALWGQDGTNYPVNPELFVKVRKTAFCGGVKWGWAERSTFLNGLRMRVWLEDQNGNYLPGTEYASYSALQIYGNMWNGPVRACAAIDGYQNGQKRCTPVDY